MICRKITWHFWGKKCKQLQICVSMFCFFFFFSPLIAETRGEQFSQTKNLITQGQGSGSGFLALLTRIDKSFYVGGCLSLSRHTFLDCTRVILSFGSIFHLSRPSVSHKFVQATWKYRMKSCGYLFLLFDKTQLTNLVSVSLKTYCI